MSPARKDPLHHRREPRHRPRDRAARRARRRERRDRRQDGRAEPEAAGHDLHRRGGDRGRRRQGAAARRATSAYEDQVAAAVAKTVETFGGIDILVNNASAISLTGTERTPMKRYDLMHAINTRGTFACSQACIPHLKKAREPAHPQHLAAAQHGDALVRAARRLHDGEVRHEHVRARHGRRVPARRHRGQRAVAAHRDRDRRDPEPARRRRGDARLAQARDHGRRRARDPRPSRRASSPATSSSTTRCCAPTA